MKPLLAIVAVGALGACAPVEDSTVVSARGDVNARCFRSGDVDNFRVATSQQAYIHSRLGGVFRLDTAPNCFDPSTTGVVVEPYVASSPQLCPGDEVRVRVLMSSPTTPRSCVARVTGPITDSSVSGLPG